jgi:membrane associated rhomboid family serine protease
MEVDLLIVLHDDNPVEIVPKVTYTIIILCFIVYAFELFLPSSKVEFLLGTFHADPKHFFTIHFTQYYIGPFSALTYCFLHVDLLHVAGNMLFLYIFGNNVEEAFGSKRFIFFYLAASMASILVQFVYDKQHTVIGASGAVSAVIGAYGLLFPSVKFYGFLYKLPIRLQCRWFIAIWLLFQFIGLFLLGNSSIAYMAHLGGFLFGLILTPFLNKPEFPLFSTRGEHS